MPVFGDILKYVAGEWDMISQAPVSFVIAVLIIAIVIWLFRRSLYTGQITLLNERLKLRDDQLGDLQKKLHADSPADALFKIGELTAKVDALSIGRWDPLTESQIQNLRHQLKAILPSQIKIQITDDARALGYGIDLAFQDNGWEIEAVRLIGGAIGIEVSPQSEMAEAVANALRSATDLEVKVTGAKSDKPPLKIGLGSKPFYT